MTTPLNGKLKLSFDCDHGQTAMRVVEQTPPLRVIRAFAIDNGAALVHLHNVSGGVLGGDQLHTDVMVAANARAQITTTSATRVYRRRTEAGLSGQSMSIMGGEDALG